MQSSSNNENSFPKEQKVSEGVYITDFRKKQTTPQSTPSLKEEYESLLATTQCDLSELNNKIYHLERSNREMKEIDPDGEDSDLVEAIAENMEVIERFKKQVELIKERLAQLEKKDSSKLSAKDLPTGVGIIDDDITDEMLENLTL
ncbi:predicted protein [Naegleria gruberi]|uniref:Predicted protein n=1 Tax=Naegleria gruberi TaxID=5762 RepID=D2VPJ3_NAEGR|nr:uncharacterized protein NAEGRDRAFT_51240 [Naegleria gruberi]EFC41218.1 predicted protein [Naegleria gruberi]|eukprot:XP_002673962.1 predicted protein [Naegleria gruberi strain NEG-M]